MFFLRKEGLPRPLYQNDAYGHIIDNQNVQQTAVASNNNPRPTGLLQASYGSPSLILFAPLIFTGVAPLPPLLANQTMPC